MAWEVCREGWESHARGAGLVVDAAADTAAAAAAVVQFGALRRHVAAPSLLTATWSLWGMIPLG